MVYTVTSKWINVEFPHALMEVHVTRMELMDPLSANAQKGFLVKSVNIILTNVQAIHATMEAHVWIL